MPGPAAAGLSLVFPEWCSSGCSLSPLTTHDPRMEAGLWWRKIFGERSYQTPMPLLRISQCRVFSGVCSVAPLRKAKTSPLQCVVSKPNCKCLLQQQPHTVLLPTHPQTCSKRTTGLNGRPSLDLPLLPGDGMHRRVLRV